MAFSECDYQTLLFEVREKIAFVSLNRPNKGNALNEKMISELTQVLAYIQQDSALRALCITGEGKHFCAGADLQEMQASVDYSLAKNIETATQLAQLMQILHDMELPVIAAVRGGSYGGAIGLLACCDLVIADVESFFCLSEVKLGLVPAVISPYVIEALGMRQAKRWMLTAEKISAEKAMQLGLVHEVVSYDLSMALENCVDNLLKNGPHAMRSVKKLCRELPDIKTTAAKQKYTANLIARTRIGSEAQERMHEFLASRHD